MVSCSLTNKLTHPTTFFGGSKGIHSVNCLNKKLRSSPNRICLTWLLIPATRYTNITHNGSIMHPMISSDTLPIRLGGAAWNRRPLPPLPVWMPNWYIHSPNTLQGLKANHRARRQRLCILWVWWYKGYTQHRDGFSTLCLPQLSFVVTLVLMGSLTQLLFFV